MPLQQISRTTTFFFIRFFFYFIACILEQFKIFHFTNSTIDLTKNEQSSLGPWLRGKHNFEFSFEFALKYGRNSNSILFASMFGMAAVSNEVR
jgi:hypothetical protein